MVFVCLLILSAYMYRSLILSIITIGFVIVFFFCFSLERYVEFKDPKITELHQRLVSVFPEASKVDLVGSNESFTLNKKRIYLCIKDERGNYYDDNSLMHVLLHEFAHVLCDEIDTEDDHKPKFRAIFASLIERASRAGIYDPAKPMIKNYCGYDK